MSVHSRRQERRGTAARFAELDPVLREGEWGYETDTGKTKIGDGHSAFSDLLYTLREGDISGGGGGGGLSLVLPAQVNDAGNIGYAVINKGPGDPIPDFNLTGAAGFESYTVGGAKGLLLPSGGLFTLSLHTQHLPGVSNPGAPQSFGIAIMDPDGNQVNVANFQTVWEQPEQGHPASRDVTSVYAMPEGCTFTVQQGYDIDEAADTFVMILIAQRVLA